MTIKHTKKFILTKYKNNHKIKKFLYKNNITKKDQERLLVFE